MAHTFNLRIQMDTPVGSLFNVISASGAAMASLDAETVPVATDTEMTIAFPYASIKGYYLASTVACTVETNSSSAVGGQTISLAANVPLTWVDGGPGTNVFSANVTKFYVTAASAGTLTCAVVYDPTP